MGRKSEIILISASAGSGKTHALTRRYVRLLLNGAAPESILAVTFTNNAAKEMKERVMHWLKKAASGAQCDETAQLMDDTGLAMPALRAKASGILENLFSNYYNLHVQTIDSFLNRIAMSSAGELGMPLRPEITMSHRRLVETAMYSIFSKEGRSALSVNEIESFLDSLPPGKSYPWDPVEKMRETYENFLSFEGKSFGTIVPSDISDKKVSDTKAQLVEAAAALLARADQGDLFHTLKSGGKRTYSGLVKPSARAAIESGDAISIIESLSQNAGVFNATSLKMDALSPEISPLMDSVMSFAKELVRLHAYHRLNGFVRLYPKFKNELEHIKSGKEDIAHIDDIAKKISGYLQKSGGLTVPEIYIRLGERVEHFLIDEFQDTDPLQWRAMLPLITEALSRGGSLFVVGDIKQAIYMFRYADYKIMRAFMAALSSGEGEAEELSAIVNLAEKENRSIEKLEVNRRSGGVIVKYAEELFKNRLPQYRGGEILSPDNDPTGLTSYEQSPEPQRQSAGLVREIIFARDEILAAKKACEDDEEDLDSPGDISDPEVSFEVVDIIKEAHTRYRYDQMAVLAPQNSNIRSVVSWLNAAGIPVASMSSLDIRERPVISELIALFTFLEFPANDIAFLNFACGDIFLKASGLNREEVLGAAALHRDKYRTGGAPLYTSFRDKYQLQWDELIEPLFSKIGYLPVYELAGQAFSSFKIFERFRDESCFLVKFLEVLSLQQGKGGADARSFIEFALDDGDDSYNAFSIELPEYIDAVRVMTFHKAKGLGFPVVINLLYEKRGRGGSASDKTIYYDGPDEKGEVNIAYVKDSSGEWDTELGKIYANRQAEERVQALNELYVVVTRAKAELTNIVVRNKAEQGKTSGAKYQYVFSGLSAGSPDPAAKAGKPQHSPSIVRQPDFPDIAEASAAVSLDAYRAVQRGLLYHEILMQIEWADADLAARLASAFDACAWKYDNNLRAEKKEITEKLLSLLSKPEIAVFFKPAPGRIVKREAEFIAASEGGRLRRVDRLILDGSGQSGKAVIIDFKTGAEQPGYRETLRTYSAAVGEALNMPTECCLVFIDEERVIKDSSSIL